MTQPVLHFGDCIEVLRGFEAESIHACVTDPPYSLGFMGKKWDRHDSPLAFQQWCEEWAREVLRILKPGGHLIAFGGTRTYHRLACAVDDAGFEVRDSVHWLYGSGFPKSLDVSKAIDAAAGAERDVVGRSPNWRPAKRHNGGGFDSQQGEGEATINITAPATPAAKQWDGFGTALKPAHEIAVLARRPLTGTVAQNVLEHGCGALNIDATRIPHNEECKTLAASQANIESPSEKCRQAGRRVATLELKPNGRWPANVIHDGSDAVLAEFAKYGETSGTARTGFPGGTTFGGSEMKAKTGTWFGDTGTAARFFYTAKASKSERDGATHPTIKPIALMRYLCRLVTPPGGIVLDPFAGSGTTLIAAYREGLRAIGIERDEDYFVMATERVNNATAQMRLEL